MLVASPTTASDLSASTDTSTGTIVAPVPAIVGGISAGVFMVIMAFLGWKWRAFFSGRAYTRDVTQTQRVLKKEIRGAQTQLCVKESTSSSSTTTSRATEDSAKGLLITSGMTHEITQDGAQHIRIPEDTTCMPRPAQIHMCLPKAFSLAEPNSTTRPSAHRLSRGLSYKASTISTASMYSTQSVEEHQVRVPAAVIMAALGPNLGRKPSVAAGNIQSAALESVGEGSEFITSSRDNRYAPRSQQLNRLSHISNGSLSLQMSDHDITTSPVGLAYGGEE